jgi:hypothetical protein
MPSVSKPQATLMAMAAHNPAFAKKKGIPMRVAKDFNRADKRTGILKKGGGGAASMMGHALSGTPLGGADNLIRKAQDRFTMFADGGAVKAKPAGPSAKERREIRSMIERGKTDAVSALRDTRDALLEAQEGTPVNDISGADASLTRLRSQLAMKDGGQVPDAAAVSPDPALLYDEYRELITKLDDPRLDSETLTEMVDRLATIEHQLEQMGLSVA